MKEFFCQIKNYEIFLEPLGVNNYNSFIKIIFMSNFIYYKKRYLIYIFFF